MQLSTKGRYAVMALLDLLAMQKEKGKPYPVKLSEIAERQEISLSYLEQLFAQLRREKIVTSVRGPGGGYLLKHAPEQTWLSTVIAAVDEPVKFRRCTGEGGNCMSNGSKCNTHHLWGALEDHLNHFLQTVNLEMVATKNLPGLSGIRNEN